jgi:hypothetical protein
MTAAARVAAGQALRLERWFCPNCERLLTKPPYKYDNGNRFHSYRCSSPLIWSVVFITEAKP